MFVGGNGISMTLMTRKNNVLPFIRSGDYFFKCGLEAYERNHLQKAKKMFERAVKLQSNEPIFHVQLAAVLSEIGEYERSNEILKDVLAKHGETYAECYFFIANNYAFLGDFEKAERAVLRYLELHPDDRFSEDAYELLELLRFEQEEDGWEAFDHGEAELIIRHERARHLLKNGDLDSAIPLLRAIVDEYPQCWAAKNHLAEALFRRGDEDEAFTICEKILTEDEGNLFAICNLALFYTKKGDTTEAKRFIDGLKRVLPLDIDHSIKVAETLCTLKQYDEAYRRLKKLNVIERKTRPELLYCFGVSLYHRNERKKAFAYFEQAAKLGDRQAKSVLEDDDAEVVYELWDDGARR